MSNITRFSPLQVERFSPFQEMERMLHDMDVRMRSLMGGRGDFEPFADIRVDVAEDEKTYTVRADLPGVAKDDIKVAIDGERVSITAEVKRESGESGRKSVYSERYYGHLSRTFTLDHAIDDSQAAAKFENGVLELTLPKKAEAASRHLLTIH